MTVFKIEQSHFPAVLIIRIHDLRHHLTHFCQQGFVLHDLYRTVIAKEATAVDCQHFHFRIRGQLLKHIFERAAAEIDFVIYQHVESKGPPKKQPVTENPRPSAVVDGRGRFYGFFENKFDDNTRKQVLKKKKEYEEKSQRMDQYKELSVTINKKGNKKAKDYPTEAKGREYTGRRTSIRALLNEKRRLLEEAGA